MMFLGQAFVGCYLSFSLEVAKSRGLKLYFLRPQQPWREVLVWAHYYEQARTSNVVMSRHELSLLWGVDSKDPTVIVLDWKIKVCHSLVLIVRRIFVRTWLLKWARIMSMF